jgi:hypothetical protein
MKKIFILSIFLLILSGCVSETASFTVVSTKTINWSKANTFVRGESIIKGEDIKHWIIFIPTGNPSISQAINKAIDSYPGAVALLDVVIYGKFWWIPYIYGQFGFIVEGTPLIDPSLATANEAELKHISYYTKDNEIITKTVSDQEFNLIRQKNSLK